VYTASLRRDCAKDGGGNAKDGGGSIRAGGMGVVLCGEQACQFGLVWTAGKVGN